VAGDLTMKNQVIRSKIILKKKELQELQQRLTQSREKFFTLQEARDFFREIEVVSNQAGCVVLSTEFFSNKYGLRPKSGRKTAEKASAIVSNSIAVTFTANYENVMAFLAKLLDRPQKVAVDLLEMTSASYSPSILQCKATFTIFVVDDKEIFSDE
jgi:hypothetical protein